MSVLIQFVIFEMTQWNFYLFYFLQYFTSAVLICNALLTHTLISSVNEQLALPTLHKEENRSAVSYVTVL